MNRRFVDTDRWQALRKLESRTRKLYDYCWDMADASGVYEVDWEYLKIDTGEKYKGEDFAKLPKDKVKKISPVKFLFIEFILVNYGTLRENYNPHKPVFRDLEKNKLKINSSLNQAWFKLEEEDEYKDEKEDEDEKEKGYQILEIQEEALLYPTFDDYWNQYDKKVGEKGKVKSLWDKLKQEEKEKIMCYIPDYKLAQPDKQYRKNPYTFLYNKSWNDELIFTNGKQNNKYEKPTAEDVLERIRNG
jgi:hypothetical protein